MNIIYISASCSTERFEKLRDEGMTGTLPQAQKYHQLLLEGLSEHIDGKIYALSALPVTRKWNKKIFFKREEEQVGKVHYIYEAFINLNLLRQFTRYNGIISNIKKIYKENPDCIIICDILNISITTAALKIGKKLGIPVVGIVTDVPGHMVGGSGKETIFSKAANNNFDKFDAFLLLTEEMNNVVNAEGKPYIVIEGHSDAKMANVQNLLDRKATPKVIMYAGGIRKQYGIERMVNSFIKGCFDGWELHIYGAGDYSEELNEIAKKNSSVKFFGTVSNQVVVEKQLEASLLINPRPTDEDYVKYSFPSKTMECMASGTPLLTTRLPGMPPEYYDYVYFIDDESEDGIQKAIATAIEIPADELYKFGALAKGFILNEKNNIKQAKKMLSFLYKIK